jgi:hypothetical protein
MVKIPNKLECAYCIRNHYHGGECRENRFNDQGCLVFKPDPRGCIRQGDFKISIPLYFNFPKLGVWCDYWAINGVDTEIRVIKIHGIEWDTRTGELIISCKCDYFINEYHENYKEPNSIPKLKVIKGGKNNE